MERKTEQNINAMQKEDLKKELASTLQEIKTIYNTLELMAEAYDESTDNSHEERATFEEDLHYYETLAIEERKKKGYCNAESMFKVLDPGVLLNDLIETVDEEITYDGIFN